MSDYSAYWEDGTGGMYYNPDGTVIGTWNDEPFDGTWWTEEGGVICFSVDAWGGENCVEHWHRGEEHFYKAAGVFKQNRARNPGNDFADLSSQ